MIPIAINDSKAVQIVIVLKWPELHKPLRIDSELNHQEAESGLE